MKSGDRANILFSFRFDDVDQADMSKKSLRNSPPVAAMLVQDTLYVKYELLSCYT
jgi:hypothetical protein